MTCCGPRCQVGFRILPAARFEFHRPLSNCHCRVLCVERKLFCKLPLPNPFFTNEPSIFPYFAVELWDPEQWQSHACRRIYMHCIRMCFMWNVSCQDTPTVEHRGCKEQFSFVKQNFTSSQQDSVQLRRMRRVRLHPACLVTKKERFLIVRLNQGPLFSQLSIFYIWGLIISPDP
jgi:hypothetical protein